MSAEIVTLAQVVAENPDRWPADVVDCCAGIERHLAVREWILVLDGAHETGLAIEAGRRDGYVGDGELSREHVWSLIAIQQLRKELAQARCKISALEAAQRRATLAPSAPGAAVSQNGGA